MLSVFGYTFTERLGRGAYGEVFKAVNQKTRDVVAVKRIATKTLCKRAQDNLVDEIGILKKLKHRNIAVMTDFSWDSYYVYIFMEYLGGGDLSSFLKSKRSLPERTIRYFLQQLAFALHYLYEKNIVHMDIKPQNILLTTSIPPVLKLADFGFAKSLEKPEKRNEIRGSLLYMAPEIYNFGIYERSCDLWSVGIILFECLFGKAPFASTNVNEVKAKLTDNSPIEIPSQCSFSKDCIDLLSKLLKRKPSERIHHEHFFIHPFIDLAHAPCPQSLQKAVDYIMIADDLYSKGELVDAYFNYKEGLSHLVSSLQIESAPGRKELIREKLLHYIKVAEDLNHQLDDVEVFKSGQNDHGYSGRPKASASIKAGGATAPAEKLSERPNAVSMGVQGANRYTDKVDNVRPVSTRDRFPSESCVFPISFRNLSNKVNSFFSPRDSWPTNASSTTCSTTPCLDVETDSQPVVKTAHEVAIERLDCLWDASSKEGASLPKVLNDLRRYYMFLKSNECKSAMDYLQSNFDKWLQVVKGTKNLDLQKQFRSELNKALTTAEELKAALKAKEGIALPSEEFVNDQFCLIS